MHPNYAYACACAYALVMGSPSYSRSTTAGVVYFNENPRTIMDGAYSTMFDTNISGVRHVLYAA